LLETVDVVPSLSDKVATSGRLNLGNAARHRRIVSKALRFTSIRRVADGTTRLALQAPMRVEVDVETSANLVTWTSLTTLSFDRQIEVSAPAAPNDESRFFRARLVSP